MLWNTFFSSNSRCDQNVSVRLRHTLHFIALIRGIVLLILNIGCYQCVRVFQYVFLFCTKITAHHNKHEEMVLMKRSCPIFHVLETSLSSSCVLKSCCCLLKSGECESESAKNLSILQFPFSLSGMMHCI